MDIANAVTPFDKGGERCQQHAPYGQDIENRPKMTHIVCRKYYILSGFLETLLFVTK